MNGTEFRKIYIHRLTNNITYDIENKCKISSVPTLGASDAHFDKSCLLSDAQAEQYPYGKPK
jgi:hypothetical protein